MQRDGRVTTRSPWSGIGTRRNAGIRPGQRALGDMYSLALGVTRDDIEAYKWLTLAIRSASRTRMIRETATKIRNRVVPDNEQRSARGSGAARELSGVLANSHSTDFRAARTRCSK